MRTVKTVGKRLLEAITPLTSASGSAPEFFFLLALFILNAVAAKRAGALPGSSTGLLVDVATVVSCACQYGCLVAGIIPRSMDRGTLRHLLSISFQPTGITYRYDYHAQMHAL